MCGKTCFVLALLLLRGTSVMGSMAATAPIPTTEPVSNRFRLSIDGRGAWPVYLARVVSLTPEQRETLGDITIDGTSDAAFATFDVASGIKLSVMCPQAVQSAVLLPSPPGLKLNISGNVVELNFSQAGRYVREQYTLEVNGDWIHSLHLFINAPQTDVPKAGDPNVIYFGPGIHEVQNTTIGSGKTVYLAQDAIVYGKVGTDGRRGAVFNLIGSNITLRGRGIIDGSRLARGEGNLICARGSNIRVEGVTLRDSPEWNFPIQQSDHVNIDNIKIIGWRGNSDGIDICNSRDVTVSNCFVRTFDDLVVIKTDKGAGESRDITVKNCVLWNEFAHALSLGAELREPVENVQFSDCEIIRDKGREWDLRVYNCDSAAVKNVTFKNIRIDECRRLISLWIGGASWSKETERGHINDIDFENITAPLPGRASSPAEFVGFDAAHGISNVKLDHVVVAGKPLQPADAKENEFVHGVVVTFANHM